jgi:Cyclic-phosphate processing Receiver domain
MDCVLFLDDDRDRHARFRARVDALGYGARHRLLYVFTAADAIGALREHEGEISQVFLDHDLCEEDHWVVPGEPSKVPTGMAVVNHIMTMRRPPAVVTVHSFNERAAIEMCARLAVLPSVAVKRIPFFQLLERLT